MYYYTASASAYDAAVRVRVFSACMLTSPFVKAGKSLHVLIHIISDNTLDVVHPHTLHTPSDGHGVLLINETGFAAITMC